MITHSFLFAAALLSFSATPFHPPSQRSEVTVPVGGPPSVRLADKASGDITKADLDRIKAVDLVGCVPGAHITFVTFTAKTASAKVQSLRDEGPEIEKQVRELLSKLPAGTVFTVQVEVKDRTGKEWDVPTASYTWRG